MNIYDAELIAMRAVEEVTKPGTYALNGEKTREFDIGWAFFADTKKFLETGDPQFRAPGLGWVFVDRENGKVDLLSSAKAMEASIEEIRARKIAGRR